MRRRARAGDGRTAQRLIELLEDVGYVVTALYPTRGYWTHMHQDCLRWEAEAYPIKIPPRDRLRASGVRLISWATMTEIVRSGGVELVREDRGGDLLVYPASRSTAAREPTDIQIQELVYRDSTPAWAIYPPGRLKDTALEALQWARRTYGVSARVSWETVTAQGARQADSARDEEVDRIATGEVSPGGTDRYARKRSRYLERRAVKVQEVDRIYSRDTVGVDLGGEA